MYLFLKHNILPSQWIEMSREEKAILLAFVDEKIASEKKELSKMKRGKH